MICYYCFFNFKIRLDSKIKILYATVVIFVELSMLSVNISDTSIITVKDVNYHS